MIGTLGGPAYLPLTGGTLTGDLTLGSNALILNGTHIVADAANEIAIRNGTNAQTLDLYGTYTDGSNYERLRVGLTGGVFTFDAGGAGTGTHRVIRFLNGGTSVTFMDMIPALGGITLFGGFGAPIATKTGTTYSQANTDHSLIFNATGTCTLTLLSAATYSSRMLFVRTIAAQSVISASSNVVPLAGGAAGTAILAATAGKWALLQSDGTNWQIMAGN